jgi:lipopolysaccharide transport system permease protein
MRTEQTFQRVGPPRVRGIRRAMEEFVAYWELTANLIARDLKTKYRGSVLGIFWSLLNPLMLMVVYTAVFSIIVRVKIPGSVPYPVFLLAGLVPWNAFAQSLTNATTSVVDNAGIVRKVYFPLEILPVSAVLSASVNFLISLALLVVIALVFGVHLGLSLLVLPVLIALQIAFTIGLGCLLAAGNVFFRDVQYFLSVLLTVWFFGTPIVYSLDLVPARLRPVFEANPMAWLVSSYQAVWAYGRWPRWSFLAAYGLVAVAVLVVGLLGYGDLKRRFAEEV